MGTGFMQLHVENEAVDSHGIQRATTIVVSPKFHL